jgi:hypothetical protein
MPRQRNRQRPRVVLPCGASGCLEPIQAKGLCRFHRERERLGTPLDAPKLVRGRICQVPGCGAKHSAQGYCTFHCKRAERGLPFDVPRRVQDKTRPCLIEGCQRAYRASGYCAYHYQLAARQKRRAA